MGVNWKIRIKNKVFWLSIIPAMILLIQAVGKTFGYAFDFGKLQEDLIDIVNAVFSVLVILGVIVDPTTVGVGDSERALGYDEPNDDH